MPFKDLYQLRSFGTIYTWQCLLSKHERKWFNSKATNESLMHIEHLNFIFHEFLKLLCTCMAYLEPNLFYINIGLLAWHKIELISSHYHVCKDIYKNWLLRHFCQKKICWKEHPFLLILISCLMVVWFCNKYWHRKKEKPDIFSKIILLI